MKRMEREQVYLEADQNRRLRALARDQGVTESELIRGGVNRVLNEPVPFEPDRRAGKEILAFIDSLIAKGPAKGRRTGEREDLYED